VSKERIEVTFGGEVKEDGVVGVVEVGEDAEKLSVDVASYRGEVGRELATCEGEEWGESAQRARRGRECA
jgi:hypothetical protein